MSGFDGAMPTPINSNSAQGIRDILDVPSNSEMEAAIAQSTAKAQIQVTIARAVSIAANAIEQIWSNFDMRSSALVDAYTNKALSALFGGKTIDAVIVTYGTGVGVISDVNCIDNLVSLRFYNATNAAINLNTVRMVVFYH